MKKQTIEFPYPARRKMVLKSAGLTGPAGMLISNPVDVRYLCGFTGEDSFLLIGPASVSLITDGRFAEQASRECIGIDVHVMRKPVSAEVAEVAKQQKLLRLGVQAEHMTLRGKDRLADALGKIKIKPVGDVVQTLRAVKNDREVRKIQKAVRIAQRAFLGLIAGGVKNLLDRSERDLAGELDYRMRLLGADSPAFQTICAAGDHSSLPHYRPDGTRVKAGQAVLFDWGAKADGYCSDLTRVVFVSTIPQEMQRLYQVVLAAQRAGISAARAGAKASTVDRAARNVIQQSGYGKQFVHSLGHGIGLEVHERPALSQRSDGRLKSGHVVTVEPGIYLPGVGGIRIEDDVLITPAGARRLSGLPREQRVMVLS